MAKAKKATKSKKPVKGSKKSTKTAAKTAKKASAKKPPAKKPVKKPARGAAKASKAQASAKKPAAKKAAVKRPPVASAQQVMETMTAAPASAPDTDTLPGNVPPPDQTDTGWDTSEATS
jgi:hypothetical protein